MAIFQPAGPPRFQHQLRGLRKLIETRGVCALLFEPGLGKTATTMDYLSILALKSAEIVDGDPEIRVLVAAPNAAVDTWVLQAQTYIHPGVNVWSEVLGGSVLNRCESLKSRGPKLYSPNITERKKDRQQLPYRGLNADRAEILYTRGAVNPQGPRQLRGKPRLIIEAINLEALSVRQQKGSKTTADKVAESVKAFAPHVIVVDEMHKIKGVGSNVSKLMARLGRMTPRRIGLTGTVMPHSPLDIYAQWRFLEPTAFGVLKVGTGGQRSPATFAQFQRDYAVMGGYMGREAIAFKNLERMQAIMSNNAIVVKKEDALDLPPMLDTVLSFQLSPKEQRVYDDLTKELAASFTTISEDGRVIPRETSAPNRLAQMMRLRQLTAGHIKTDEGLVVEVGSSKVDHVRSLVQDTLEAEKRIVIFAVFTREIDALEKALSVKGTTVMRIDGRTPKETRLAMRQKFGTESDERIIIVAQIKTLSVSVNELVTANHAIFTSLPSQRDDLIQARDRLNRLGQQRSCTFWYLLAMGTVDEVVYESHRDRTNLEAAILKHIGEIKTV